MYHSATNRCHNGYEDRGINTNHDGNDTRTVQRRRDVLLVLRREYQKAYARTEGVEDVDVSLARGGPRPVRRRHSERSQGEGHTPRSGYTIRDPDKAKRYEQQQAELADGKQRLLLAGGASVVVAALMGWMIFVVGRFESASLAMDIAALALALGTMFGPGRYITKKAFQSLRRGIFNQHVLLEAGAFAGLLGGFLGLFVFSGFPTVHFFAVSVFITTYHILSEYTSLTVRTRASQAVQSLLNLQPDTARRVTRNGRSKKSPSTTSRSTTESASSPARASLSTASSSKETQRSTSRLPPASPSPSRRARATR